MLPRVQWPGSDRIRHGLQTVRRVQALGLRQGAGCKVKAFTCSFHGRKSGALGICYRISGVYILAATDHPDDILMQLYNAGYESINQVEAVACPLKPLELSNPDHGLWVRAFGKFFRVRYIARTDAEANAFMAANESTGLIDTDPLGNLYIADLEAKP